MGASNRLMAALRWIAFALSSLWAMGGVIVMLGYGSGRSLSELGQSALINFAPFLLCLFWIILAARRSPG